MRSQAALPESKAAAYQACVHDERAAYDELRKKWPRYSAKSRVTCAEPGDGAAISYVELQTCLDMQPGGSLTVRRPSAWRRACGRPDGVPIARSACARPKGMTEPRLASLRGRGPPNSLRRLDTLVSAASARACCIWVEPDPSLRAKRSNPENVGALTFPWIASSLTLLAMIIASEAKQSRAEGAYDPWIASLRSQ